jgi:hypothetical protein
VAPGEQPLEGGERERGRSEEREAERGRLAQRAPCAVSSWRSAFLRLLT